MAPIAFTVTHDFDATPSEVWDEMTDWTAHGDWIPATRVEIDEGDPRSVGGTFTGYSGYGPLTLIDHMRVTQIDWDDATATGRCEVAKLGPVLQGRAGFTVSPNAGGARVEWFEEVTVPYVPALAAPVINKLSAFGFKMGMKSLAKNLSAKPA